MDFNFNTPLRKLVFSFKASRDKWKEKAQKSNYELKIKRNRIKFLEESKAKLKEENATLKAQIKSITGRGKKKD